MYSFFIKIETMFNAILQKFCLTLVCTEMVAKLSIHRPTNFLLSIWKINWNRKTNNAPILFLYLFKFNSIVNVNFLIDIRDITHKMHAQIVE